MTGLVVHKLNIVKDVRVKEFPQCNIKAVANIVNRNNARILALVIEHSVRNQVCKLNAVFFSMFK